MSAALAPFGLRPARDMIGRVRAQRIQNGIISGYTSSIYQYSPVLLVTSTYNTLNIGATGGDLVGSFAGLEYTDSNSRRQFSKYWPANLVPLAGTTWNVWVWTDPHIEYEIQANGALGEVAGRGLVGQQIELIAGTGTGGIGSGSTVTQLSGAAANASAVSSSGQQQLRILEKAPYVDNDWGDAFPILRVSIARHQYASNKVAV